MANMIKRTLAGLLFLMSAVTFAQNGTSSPYSFFGVGDIMAGGTTDSRSMGGIGVVSDSIHINLLNPAGYSSLKRTSLSVGLMHTRSTLSTNTSEADAKATNLNHIALAIPVKKWGFALGLMPYSSVGYRLSYTVTEGEDEGLLKRYSGKGGVNRAFFATSYALTPKLNFGLQYDYNFGQVETQSSQFLTDIIQLGSRETNKSDLSGHTLTAGLSYQTKIKKGLDVYASAVFTTKTAIRSDNTRTLSTIADTGSGESVIDTRNIDVDSTTIDIPSRFTFGAGIGKARKWLVAAEVSFAGGVSGNRFNDIGASDDPGNPVEVPVSFSKASRYAIGGYFIPKYDAYKGYFRRVVYRAGLRYEDTGLNLGGKNIEDMAVTFGLGLPFRGSFTNVNLGVEFGRRGTRAEGLILENYTRFTASFSFSDLWFVKKRYD